MANAEDSDGSVRVTRRSMRRMASVESLTESVDTPTVAPRNKKLNTISELVGTPKKSVLDSPRRTRKTSEEPAAVGSPFRRTTRASSQDKDVTASPLPVRASRRSALAESDTDDAPSTPSKGGRNKRKSTIASPKIAQIVEEPEDDNEKEEQGEDNEEASTLNSSNELELRTRSITKSPSVSPPKPALNGSRKSNGNLDSSHEDEPEAQMKVFKSRNNREQKTSVTEISFHESDNDASPLPTMSNSDRLHKTMISQKTTFEGCLERIASSGGEKRASSSTFRKELEAELQNKDSPSGEKLVSATNTPVRGRRSIHDSESTSDETPKMKAALEDLAKLRESFVAKDSPKSAKKSPPAEGTPAKTPVKTPQSAKKTPQSSKKMSVGEGDDTSKLLELMEDFVDETDEVVGTQNLMEKMQDFEDDNANDVKTPKSAKKLANGTPARDKTPKSAKKATPGKSPKNSNGTVLGNHAMEITTNGNHNETTTEPEAMDVDEGEADSHDMEETLNKSGASQKSSPTKSEKKYSMFGYVAGVSQSSKRLSVPVLSSIEKENKGNSDEEAAATISRRKSWAVSVTRPAGEPIDNSAKTASPIVIKGQDTRVKGYSSDEEVEDDDEGSNKLFIDDEAEVGSEESITESEANYIKEHEIPDGGEYLGSEDSSEDEDYEGEEEEEDGSSFLAADEEDIDDQYSMDSDEDEIEELEEKPTRKSRIIQPSSSEDDEPEVEKSQKKSLTRSIPATTSDDEEEAVEEKSPAKAAKSPAKSPKSASKKAVVEAETEEEHLEKESPVKASQSARKSLKSPKVAVENNEPETMEVEAPVSKNLKRRRESGLNVSVVVKAKRIKLSDTIIETPDNAAGIAELFEELSEEPVKKKKAKKSQQPEAVDVEKVINKCDEYMSGYTAEKKAKMALKREKKAQKMAQKQKEAEEAAKLAADGLDSSNNSNKENAIAPKKKNKSKIKKQKLVANMPEEKESLAETVSKAQEKLERKRQKKLEKKLAKQQSAESETVKEVEEASVPTKKSKKSSKSAELAEPETVPELITEKKKTKKIKVVETPEEPMAVEPSKKSKKAFTETPDEPAAGPSKKKKKHEAIAEEPASVELPKKKKKKENIAEVEEPAVVPEKKKKTRVIDEEPAPEPIQKTKKRKLEEPTEETVVQPKKKLNVLKQIENPFQIMPQARTSRNDDQDLPSIPLMSQKLKKVIPQKVEIEKKRKKKKATGKKSIPEPRKSLPRPVFTTAGTFVEAPMSPPFKFQSTTYVPIAATSSLATSYGVVAFEGKKKKQPQQQLPAADWKTQAMFRNMKARDGSSKNMAALVRKQQSL